MTTVSLGQIRRLTHDLPPETKEVAKGDEIPPPRLVPPVRALAFKQPTMGQLQVSRHAYI